MLIASADGGTEINSIRVPRQILFLKDRMMGVALHLPRAERP
jgi:hypothetical protein